MELRAKINLSICQFVQQMVSSSDYYHHVVSHFHLLECNLHSSLCPQRMCKEADLIKKQCWLQLQWDVFASSEDTIKTQRKTFFFSHELRCFYCISVTETALLHIALTAKKTHPQCQWTKWFKVAFRGGSRRTGRRLSPLKRCTPECRH